MSNAFIALHFWLLVGWLSGQRVPSRLYFVYVSVVFLLFGTHFLVVLFELLRGSEPWEEREVRSHDYITYKNIFYERTKGINNS